MSDVLEKQRLLKTGMALKVGRPRLYKVTLNWMVGKNTPEKNVKICGAYEQALKRIFRKSTVDALSAISECRRNNTSIISEYSWEVAESKSEEANDFVHKRLPHGFNPAMVFGLK